MEMTGQQFDTLMQLLSEGRKCPYLEKDSNLDNYCSTLLDVKCGYQGEIKIDQILRKYCRRE